jgi:hypothetical protein
VYALDHAENQTGMGLYDLLLFVRSMHHAATTVMNSEHKITACLCSNASSLKC